MNNYIVQLCIRTIKKRERERERVTIADDVSFILLDNAHAHPAESELVGHQGHYFKHKQNKRYQLKDFKSTMQ